MSNEQNDSLVVIAENPGEMVEAQEALCLDVGRKIEIARAELKEAEDLLYVVRNAGLRDGTAKRQFDRAESRVNYLVKVQQALAAGYVLVPDMPAETIAIRTKGNVRSQIVNSEWGDLNIAQERAKSLPAGEGFYSDPELPKFTSKEEHKDEKGNTKRTYTVETTGNRNTSFDLPGMFLKPRVVRRIGDALELKLFDELALAPGPGWKWKNAVRSLGPSKSTVGDPMVIGRIIDKATQRRLCFLVAWFIDTKEI